MSMLEKYMFGDPEAGTVLIQPVDGHDLEGIENEVSLIAANCVRSFHLITVKVGDWNTDLSLWSAYRTDLFSGVAAASPSVWFPGFSDYMKEHEISTGAVYLSLGDREEKTRNPVMSTVGDRIREAYALLSERGVKCVLEWNEGNHFKDADVRTAKAFSWVIKNRSDGKNRLFTEE